MMGQVEPKSISSLDENAHPIQSEGLFLAKGFEEKLEDGIEFFSFDASLLLR